MRKIQDYFGRGRLALPRCVEEVLNSRFNRLTVVIPVPGPRGELRRC